MSALLHMKHIALNKHPRWGLYQQLRTAIQQELQPTIPGIASLEDDVDEYLRKHFADVAGELGNLFRADYADRAARDCLSSVR
jgi:hypothetical protein